MLFYYSPHDCRTFQIYATVVLNSIFYKPVCNRKPEWSGPKMGWAAAKRREREREVQKLQCIEQDFRHMYAYR